MPKVKERTNTTKDRLYNRFFPIFESLQVLKLVRRENDSQNNTRGIITKNINEGTSGKFQVMTFFRKWRIL